MSGFKPPILFCRIPCNPGLLSRGVRKPSATSVLAFAKACEFTVCARFIIEVFEVAHMNTSSHQVLRNHPFSALTLHPCVPTSQHNPFRSPLTGSLSHCGTARHRAPSAAAVGEDVGRNKNGLDGKDHGRRVGSRLFAILSRPFVCRATQWWDRSLV